MANRFRTILTLFLLAASCLCAAAAADGAPSEADRYLGYKWQPVLLSSWKSGDVPQVQANMEAFRTLVSAEKASGQGKYLLDIINGLWFYTTAHTWSVPSETAGALPPREGQSPTPTSLQTADMLLDAWKAFSDKISDQLPVLGPSLDATMHRLAGKGLK